MSILYIRQKGLDVDANVFNNRESLLNNTKKSISIDEFITYFTTVFNMKEYEISKLTQKQKDIYFHKDYWHYFDFDFIDEKGRRYNHLSHGEKVIYSQLLNIFFYINGKANEKVLFLFDEPETSLHPNWQKQYINEVTNLLKKIPKQYHFVFATHSPFLLSDLPKENVIFLEKDKESGNCKNVTKETEINTFGANIHTLLSHGFFMEDGLMGEFAKNKIEEIKKFYDVVKKEDNPKEKYLEEYNKKINDFENIQSIIGEPFLKTVIKNYLDELEIIFHGKKEFLKNEIKRLQDLEKSLDD